jgi:hypothetical protein
MRSIIHNLREQTAALRAALLAPAGAQVGEGLESHLPALQDAALTLERLTSTFGGPEGGRRGPPGALIEPGTRRELKALAGELDTAGRLIAHGLAFQQGLTRLLASSAAGYRPDGEPVELSAAGSISVRG